MPGIILPFSTRLPFATTTASLQLAGGGFLLVGWAIEETTATARARVILRDGQSDTSEYLFPVTLGPGESDRDTVAGHGVFCESGVWLQVASGSVQGCLFVVPSELVQRGEGWMMVGQQRAGEMVDMGALA